MTLANPRLPRVQPRSCSPLDIVIIGLSITSSWGNGHATTYRSLVRELTRRGHRVLFLEHDKPWYAANRDLPHPPFGRTELYKSVDDLKRRFAEQLAKADVVMVGSYVPEGVAVGRWACDISGGSCCFYDIDTPVTLAKLGRWDYEYLTPELIGEYDLYLSFTGGPTLELLEQKYGSPMARALYCSFDPELYFPQPAAPKWDLGYLGTYSADRQPALERLLIEPAQAVSDCNFVVAGSQYPAEIHWPDNVNRIEHLPPAQHRVFYNAQRYTLNITRADMIRAGYSPSVRLFEAAACAVPIISDNWRGLETLFDIDHEILVAEDPEDVLRILRDTPERERVEIGRRAQQRVLEEHTAAHRAAEFERYVNMVRR